MALCLIAGTAVAETPAALQPIMEKAAQQCQGAMGGTLTIGEDALTRVDLTGNGAPDAVLDMHAFECDTIPSLYCGTGGCPVHLNVGDHVSSLYSRGWTIVDLAMPVFVSQVHGTRCDGHGATPCAEALVWDTETAGFVSVAKNP